MRSKTLLALTLVGAIGLPLSGCATNAPNASSGSSSPSAAQPGPNPDAGVSSGAYSGSASGGGRESLGRYGTDPDRH